MKFIYFLLTVIAIVYFIVIPILFNQGKINVSELMVFLGVLPLALIAIFQEQLKRWFFSPNIVIDFKLAAPFCSKTPFYAFLDKEKVIDTEAYYFRVKVINNGKTSAKLCEVVIFPRKSGHFEELVVV